MIALVFILNWLLVTATLALALNYPLIWAGMAGVCLLVPLALFSASYPFACMKSRLMGARPLTQDEEAMVMPALAELGRRIGFPYRPAILVLPRPMPAAFALGGRIVVLTAGLINFCQREELVAVIGHEAGHQLSGDATRRMVLQSLNLTGWSAGFFSGFILALGINLGRLGAKKNIYTVAALFLGILGLCCKAVAKLEALLLAAGFRREEYAADAFCARLGVGHHLAGYLKRLEPIDFTRPDWPGRLWLEHPCAAERVAKLCRG